MTTHYIDLTLRPDPELNSAHLMGALADRLHRTLVQLRADDIGISFPGYGLRPPALGTVLRLHGGESALRALMAQPWLLGMRDHVKLAEVMPVPMGAAHRVVRRRQFKTNVERLRRRRMRRKGETSDQAATAIPEGVKRRVDVPFLQLRSASTGQPFCLFVDQETVVAAAVAGTFSSYGLSRGGTVPWF